MIYLLKTKFDTIMKKYLLFVVMAFVLGACSINNPEANELIGTWSEPYHVETMVKSIVFTNDGMACYKYQPDTTYDVIITYSGYYVNFQYSVLKNNRLRCTSMKQGVIDDVPFDYVTSYSIDKDTLTLDSLYLGTHGYVKSLKLQRYE